MNRILQKKKKINLTPTVILRTELKSEFDCQILLRYDDDFKSNY